MYVVLVHDWIKTDCWVMKPISELGLDLMSKRKIQREQLKEPFLGIVKRNGFVKEEMMKLNVKREMFFVRLELT